ncbi:hypothetical protein GHT06_016373 [Daphnia sinensis]|uniref:MAM domain-containing protein n=1 Tax=Daphnia sinensis TaxID=1820382 RepID=A0AAD5L6F6_9CRUS|nr:hypothetical protein GHT06_016373 [Daphnia sinensis]
MPTLQDASSPCVPLKQNHQIEDLQSTKGTLLITSEEKSRESQVCPNCGRTFVYQLNFAKHLAAAGCCHPPYKKSRMDPEPDAKETFKSNTLPRTSRSKKITRSNSTKSRKKQTILSSNNHLPNTEIISNYQGAPVTKASRDRDSKWATKQRPANASGHFEAQTFFYCLQESTYCSFCDLQLNSENLYQRHRLAHALVIQLTRCLVHSLPRNSSPYNETACGSNSAVLDDWLSDQIRCSINDDNWLKLSVREVEQVLGNSNMDVDIPQRHGIQDDAGFQNIVDLLVSQDLNLAPASKFADATSDFISQKPEKSVETIGMSTSVTYDPFLIQSVCGMPDQPVIVPVGSDLLATEVASPDWQASGIEMSDLNGCTSSVYAQNFYDFNETEGSFKSIITDLDVVERQMASLLKTYESLSPSDCSLHVFSCQWTFETYTTIFIPTQKKNRLKTKQRKIMANLLIFLTALLAISSSGSVPSSAKNRRGRQWVGELEDQSGCSFPVSTGQNGTMSNSPVERVSLCNFTISGPLVDSVYPWRKGLASLSNWLGGPPTDASNSSDGGYAFFETSFLPGQHQQLPRVQPKAWLKSPVYRATTPHGYCLRFSYNIQGASASKLRLLRVQMVPTLEGHGAAPKNSPAATTLIANSILMPSLSSNTQQKRQADGNLIFASPWTPFRKILVNQTGWQEVVDEVWLSSDSTRGEWLNGHVTYSSPYPHAFIFEAVPNLAYSQYRGHVAIDDIQFSSGPSIFIIIFVSDCVILAECEFNVDFCQWANDPDGDFDWSLSRGSLWTNTGPLRDQLSSQHNFNFGGYAFIDSRQPHFPGSRASLTSDILPANQESALCFVFWVHMFGAGIGSLRVLQKSTDNTSDSSEQEIWQLSGQSGPRDSWYRAQVTLASSSPFKIRLEATVGESGYGDIAIDSLRIENGSCPGLPEWAVNRGFDCTFQNGLCGWVLTNSRPGITSMWTRNSADIFAGRPDGHSQQNVLSHLPNSYMLFDTYLNGHTPGSRGFISSLLQRSTEHHCLSFWFYMASASAAHPRMGALEVVLYEPVNSGNETINAAKHTSAVSSTLWRLENHQEEKWLSAQVSFVPASGGYISFIGIRGEGLRGIIAIDDVTLFRGRCQILPADAAVSPLDCSFDQNFCKWNVDTEPVIVPSSTEAITTEKQVEAAVTTEKQVESAVTTQAAITTEKLMEITATTEKQMEIAITTEKQIEASATTEKPMEVSITTEIPPTTNASSLNSKIKSTPGNDEQPIVFPVDDEQVTTEDSIPTTTADVVPTSTGIAELIELIPPQSSPPATEARRNSVQTIASILVSEVSPTVGTSTEMKSPSSSSVSIPSSTPSTTTVPTTRTSTTTASATRASTTTASLTDSKASPSASSPSIVIKAAPDNVNKDSAVRGVSGLYDEITSFGGNTIEVISTSREGATKSIIISQPVRSRFRRSAKWIGYNHPRDSRIVNYRRAPSSSAEEGVWKRPKPVPHWLRSRLPSDDDEQINPVSAHQTFTSQRTSPPKLFAFSNVPRSPVNDPSPQSGNSNSSSESLVKENPQWLLSSSSASLYGVRDHTLQLTDGGYVYMEGKGKSSVSRLFSPTFPGNATYCLSFFFTMAYNSPNSTLTVYRRSEGPLDELWRVTAAAIDRSGSRNKSPWIPARVPIPTVGEAKQSLVIEGSTDSGGIGLDDLRFRQVPCSIRP